MRILVIGGQESAKQNFQSGVDSSNFGGGFVFHIIHAYCSIISIGVKGALYR